MKPKNIIEKVILFLAAGFGTGFIKKAPGTWGTIPGVIMAYFLMPYPIAHVFVIISLFFVGIYLSKRASEILNTHDAGMIVIDEIVGILITLFIIPVTFLNLFLGFLLFRFFDIIKPPPIGYIDKHTKGGFGIMIDDVVAGIFAWLPLFAIQHFL